MLRFVLPPRGSLPPASDVDPLRYYYAPLVGHAFRARIDLGLALLPDDAPSSQRVLEIGYGSGLLLPTLARHFDHVDGVDLSAEPGRVRDAMSKMGVSVGELVQGSVTSLPQGNASYDLVVAFSILEHLRPEELPAALAEVARVLKPGGHFLVGCPAVHKGMNLAFAAIGFNGIDDHHFSSIHDVLGAAASGFTVEKSATWPGLPGGSRVRVPLGWAPYNAVLLARAQPGKNKD